MPKRKNNGSYDPSDPKRRRRLIIYTDSSSSESDVETQKDNENPNQEPERPSSPGPVIISEEPSALCPINDSVEPEAPEVGENLDQPAVVDPVQVAKLDDDILKALGASSEDAPNFGPNIHENLPQLWLPILRKVLPDSIKEKLLKTYLVPDNCRLLQAPKLNPEISFVLTDMSRNRDKKIEESQQQLGIGISAVSIGLNYLLQDEKLKAVEALSDSCRILADLHSMNTQLRRKIITPGLDKTFLNHIQDVERDDTLFGNTLCEKIRASRALEKQGQHIKKNVPSAPKSTQSIYSNPMPSTSRSRYQGNWAGPSRFFPPANRGGRGGPRRTAARAPPPPPPRQQTSSSRNYPPRVSSMSAKTRHTH